MTDTVQDILQAHSDAYAHDSALEVVSHYDVPLAIYEDNHISLLETEADIESAVADMFRNARAQGVEQFAFHISTKGQIRNRRFPVTIIWHFKAAVGNEIAMSEIQYFFRRRPSGRLVIEMMDFKKVAFPRSYAALTSETRQN